MENKIKKSQSQEIRELGEFSSPYGYKKKNLPSTI